MLLNSSINCRPEILILYLVYHMGHCPSVPADPADDLILHPCELPDQVLIPCGSRCCGTLQLEAGDFDAARQLARANLEAFGDENIEAIVVGDAGCARTLQRDYQELLELDEFSVPVYHISELLTGILSDSMDLSPLPRKAIFLPSRAPGEVEDWNRKLLELFSDYHY